MAWKGHDYYGWKARGSIKCIFTKCYIAKWGSEMTVGEILKDGSTWMPADDYDINKPKVTVVLPTFRWAMNGYFQRAVDSVLAQTFRDLELIIVDNCSIDGTYELMQDYMRTDHRVSCIRHSFNIGLPAISEYEAYLKSSGTLLLIFLMIMNGTRTR